MTMALSAKGIFFALCGGLALNALHPVWTAVGGGNFAFSETPRSGFNHLEFDRPIVTTNPQSGNSGPSDRDIQEILEAGKGTSTAPPRDSANEPPRDQAKSPTSVSLKDLKVKKFDWVKPSDGQGHFLTPRLRGPQTDSGQGNTITTQATWDKQSGGCDVSRADLLCQKAKSLRELLLRFSGDEDFFTRQCQQTCDEGLEATLTTFRVKDRRGQSYDILQAGDKCRYQLGAIPGRIPWLAMEGDSGTCSCLPRNCAN